MKILILSTAYPLRGGIAHFTGLLYKELSKSHDVSVITFKRQYPSFIFPGKTQMDEKATVEKIDTQVLVDSINPFNWLSVGNKIKKLKPDLIIYKYWMPFFGPCFGTITRIAKKNKKTKTLVICDNVIPHERKPGDRVFTKYFFNSVDCFILMSKTVQDDLLKIKPSAKHRLLFHPIYSNFGKALSKDVAKLKLKISAEKVILFFGFIRKYKGVDTLFEATALLKNKFDFKVILAGEFYEDEKKYLNVIKKLELDKYVKIFSDFIPNEDVKYYFSAADVVVLPYKNATQSGIAQIAMNFNKPVIATNVGGLSEIVMNEKTGLLVEKDNPKALADAIVRFYQENLEQSFNENIKLEKNKYSWDNFTNQLLKFVNE